MNVIEQTSKGVLIPSDNQHFKIISDFKESGDQPEAINKLIKKLYHLIYFVPIQEES